MCNLINAEIITTMIGPLLLLLLLLLLSL